jgi:hypothetical protein
MPYYPMPIKYYQQLMDDQVYYQDYIRALELKIEVLEQQLKISEIYQALIEKTHDIKVKTMDESEAYNVTKLLLTEKLVVELESSLKAHNILSCEN